MPDYLIHAETRRQLIELLEAVIDPDSVSPYYPGRYATDALGILPHLKRAPAIASPDDALAGPFSPFDDCPGGCGHFVEEHAERCFGLMVGGAVCSCRWSPPAAPLDTIDPVDNGRNDR